ncbi:MAG: aldo/keto reductase [Gammaproteobacteria bacterium RIFOXYA12_FULL_61_12]|nr:MAG: aldo/keto reductase [Gammaproteobacteria bacterium RIFOXYD12_FULL_61_37]OGT92784.1 MAG: aldo/keto reductase [Gammaproteobacteria bacterium RIFOXYA12_FULL_61_12]
MDLRPLGATGMAVSPLGLGTVKFGRNQQVKYPRPFTIPDDATVRDLLALARDLGINMLDTAPAYGSSQERLGKLLPGSRHDWVIVSKVGEFFEHGESRFDFGYETTVRSVEESLRSLKSDYLDLVLIHSDGNDLRILQQEGAADALDRLKERGLIRAHGMSSKTVEGGLMTVERMDVVMATCNLSYNDELPVLHAAERLSKGVLIKKGLQSGHIASEEGVIDSMCFVFSQPGVTGMIVGTIDPTHLRGNVSAVEAALTQ